MESESFELEIISPTSNLVVMVEWIELESPTGSFFVGPHHAPLVSLIKKKSAFCYKKCDEKNTQSVIVHEGLFRINAQNKATLVLT